MMHDWKKILEQDRVWVDRQGREIPLSLMSTRYIRNALPFAIQGAFRVGWDLVKFADGPLGPQGDMAMDAVDTILDNYLEGRMPLIKAMERELAKRANRNKYRVKAEDWVREEIGTPFAVFASTYNLRRIS